MRFKPVIFVTALLLQNRNNVKHNSQLTLEITE